MSMPIRWPGHPVPVPAARASEPREAAWPRAAAGSAPVPAPPADALRRDTEARHWRASQLSLGLIVCALLALLAVPTWTERRTASIRAGVLDVVASARDLTDDIERDMAVEAEAQRLYSFGAQRELLDRFGAARADDERALARLRPLALGLGDGVPASADALARELREWQRAALEAPGTAPRPAAEDELFLRAVRAARELDVAIGRVTEQGRQNARDAQALEAHLTVVLGALVLAAVLLLGQLARRLRGLARRETALRQELETSVARRERLIRGFSHDLKNPLGVADGYAELLEGGYLEDPVRRREGLQRLRRAISSALRLADDLLDIARAEAGMLSVAREVVDVGALAREVAAECAPQAAAAGLMLHIDLPRTLPAADTDPARVRQILGNLLSNAIKYGADGGSVRVEARVEHATDGSRPTQRSVVVSVSDRGPGVPLERQAWIFDEFTRLDPDAAPGTGLGLAISLRLARALGGDLVLESIPGDGSTFSLWLPESGR
jgi:signal transduction histidine kinase